jgi:hypothetical protein
MMGQKVSANGSKADLGRASTGFVMFRIQISDRIIFLFVVGDLNISIHIKR